MATHFSRHPGHNRTTPRQELCRSSQSVSHTSSPTWKHAKQRDNDEVLTAISLVIVERASDFFCLAILVCLATSGRTSTKQIRQKRWPNDGSVCCPSVEGPHMAQELMTNEIGELTKEGPHRHPRR